MSFLFSKPPPVQWHQPPAYFQKYRTKVLAQDEGLTLLGLFCQRFKFKTRTEWEEFILKGQVTLNGQIVSPASLVKEGQLLHSFRDDVLEPPVNIGFSVLVDQKGLLVINKSAPLPVHPCGRYYKNSLLFILQSQDPTTKFYTLHRLDTWTTGLVFLAKHESTAKIWHKIFLKDQLKKVYGVLATGPLPVTPFTVSAPIGRLSGDKRTVDVNGKTATTDFIPLTQHNGVHFLLAYLRTGRTNQIRVHIQNSGGEVLNDPLYSSSHNPEWPFMGLHAVWAQAKPDGLFQEYFAPWPWHFKEFFNNADFNPNSIVFNQE